MRSVLIDISLGRFCMGQFVWEEWELRPFTADILLRKSFIFCITYHMCLKDEVGHKLHSSLGVAQLEVGMGVPHFQLDVQLFGMLAESTFITDLWRECSKVVLELRGTKREVWCPAPRSSEDWFIVEFATSEFPRRQLIQINRC